MEIIRATVTWSGNEQNQMDMLLYIERKDEK